MIIGGYRSQLVGDIIAFAIQVTAEANKQEKRHK
jgi:hypothetical protein